LIPSAEARFIFIVTIGKNSDIRILIPTWVWERVCINILTDKSSSNNAPEVVREIL
jgi:hypothetical protein